MNLGQPMVKKGWGWLQYSFWMKTQDTCVITPSIWELGLKNYEHKLKLQKH